MCPEMKNSHPFIQKTMKNNDAALLTMEGNRFLLGNNLFVVDGRNKAPYPVKMYENFDLTSCKKVGEISMKTYWGGFALSKIGIYKDKLYYIDDSSRATKRIISFDSNGAMSSVNIEDEAAIQMMVENLNSIIAKEKNALPTDKEELEDYKKWTFKSLLSIQPIHSDVNLTDEDYDGYYYYTKDGTDKNGNSVTKSTVFYWNGDEATKPTLPYKPLTTQTTYEELFFF